MHMRHKEKIKRYSIVLLLVFISVITVSLISGRINTTPIVVMKQDGIDISKKLDEQSEFFGIKEILKSESGYFQGSIVTDYSQIKGKRLLYPLKAGSPIPLAALTDETGAGQFAASMPKGKTIHKLVDAASSLPPVQTGDVINIALTVNASAEGGKDNLTTGLLLQNVKIHTVKETNIYVEVTLEQDLLLSTASQVGSFIYQLPGQKASPACLETESADGESTADCVEEPEENHRVISKEEILEMVLNGEFLIGEPDKKEDSVVDKAKDAAGDLLDDVVGGSEDDSDEEGGDTQ